MTDLWTYICFLYNYYIVRLFVEEFLISNLKIIATFAG